MELNKIFEGAKFPDIFMLRCGMPAVFVGKTEDRIDFIYQPKGTVYSGLVVYPNGQYSYYGEENELDVVGRYHEPIDEEKLDELARERYEGPLTWPQEYRGGEFAYKFVECFKEGYRKAKEE